ncbi:MAG TPA: D-alanyl-D-alanine carboxypeptidase family protein [Pyrinomonadaceae bacterium]|nr:D-alanyl-D-alanine carboxypeptidase family protein [Pyrinomonadaceae bacterium]
MTNAKVHVALILAVLAAVVTFVSFTARSSSGQSSRTRRQASVKPTARIAELNRSERAGATSAFMTAAAQNATLRSQLSWSFGGKQQRGWHLYDLLIGKTLDTRDDTDTSDFASALAKWQKRSGLSADGVLDEDALMRMVSQWQSNRLKNRAYAEPGQLVTAPPTDFYDPGRAAELRQVERNTYDAYKRMVAAAIADPSLKLARTSSGELAPGEKYFKIISAFRSREYQDQLRRKSPNAGRAGLAVNSPHFTGRALDIYVGGDPVDTKDSNRAIQVNTPAYRWLVHNAVRFGFRPYFYEPWHWEYVK